MIIDSKGMRRIEKASGKTIMELMETAGKAVAIQIEKHTKPGDTVLFIAGKGNNGGDAFVAAANIDRRAIVYLLEGEPVGEAALGFYNMLPKGMEWTGTLFEAIEECDVIVDAMYGFGFHGLLNAEARNAARLVNDAGKRVFSIDLNSGAEADTGRYDFDAIVSERTFALDCYKPFHMLAKEHRLFKNLDLLDLGLPHEDPGFFQEMNEDVFFCSLEKKDAASYKGTFGKTLLIGGSYGMAGAMNLNVLGAKTLGAPYIEVCLPHEIYPIVSLRNLTPVFHPFGEHDVFNVLEKPIQGARSIAFGSGATNMPKKGEILDLVLQNAKCPVVLDAEALRLLQYNTYILRFVKAPVVLTPHIGEFATMLNKPIEYIMDAPLYHAQKFAKDYGVILVLKGPNTIVASGAGDAYINQTGNQGLAQAGSGDLLTGMIAATLTMTRDIFRGVAMAVWLHGYLADMSLESHSMQLLDFNNYPSLMDALFKKHGF